MHVPCLSAEHDVRIGSHLHFIRIRDCHEKITTSWQRSECVDC